MKTKDIAKIGLLCAIAAVLGYVESLLPPFVPVQGFKVGLANIAVMYTLYRFGIKHAFFVMIVKVLITSLWFSPPSTFIYSAFGGSFALLAMWLSIKLKFSEIGTSISGGVFHNAGQIAASALVLKTTATLYLLTFLLPLGILTGVLVGTIVKVLIKYIK